MDPMEGLLPGGERSDDDDFCIDDLDDFQLFDNVETRFGEASDNSSTVRGDLEEKFQQTKDTAKEKHRRKAGAEKKEKSGSVRGTPLKRLKQSSEPSYKVVYPDKGPRNASRPEVPAKASHSHPNILVPSDLYHEGYSFELDPELFYAVSSRIEEDAHVSYSKADKTSKKAKRSPENRRSEISDNGDRDSLSKRSHIRGYSGQRRHRSGIHDFLTPTSYQHAAMRSPRRMSTIRENSEVQVVSPSKPDPASMLPKSKFQDHLTPAPDSDPTGNAHPTSKLDVLKEMLLYTLYTLGAALWSDDNTAIDRVFMLPSGKLITVAPPLLQVLIKEEPYLVAGILLFVAWSVLVAIFKVLSAFHTMYRLLIRPPLLLIFFLLSRGKLAVHGLCAACLVYLFVGFVDYTEMLRHNQLVDEEDPFMFVTNGSVENIDFAHVKTITPEEMLVMVRHLRIMLLFPTEIIRRFYDGFNQIYIPKRPDAFIDVIFWLLGIINWVVTTCVSYFYHLFLYVSFIFVVSFPIVKSKRAQFKYVQTYFATLISLVVVSASVIISIVKVPVLVNAVKWVSSLSFLIFFLGGAGRITTYLLHRRM